MCSQDKQMGGPHDELGFNVGGVEASVEAQQVPDRDEDTRVGEVGTLEAQLPQDVPEVQWHRVLRGMYRGGDRARQDLPCCMGFTKEADQLKFLKLCNEVEVTAKEMHEYEEDHKDNHPKSAKPQVP